VLEITLTVIAAIAAVLGYFIERARYFRDIEPDLELSPHGLSLEEMHTTLQESWGFYIYIAVENKSDNPAYDLEYGVNLSIFPQRGRANVMISKHTDMVPGVHERTIRAHRKTVIPIWVGWNNIKNREYFDQILPITVPAPIDQAGFEAHITIIYDAPEKNGLTMLLLTPFRFKKTYTREIRYGFGVIPNQSQPSQYDPYLWHFPNNSLESQSAQVLPPP